MQGSNKPVKKWNFKKYGLITLALVVLVGGAFLIRNQVVNAGPCKSSLNDPLYGEAAQTIKRGNVNEMKQLSEKIQKIKGYDKSVNCLYPILAYDMAKGGNQPVVPVYTQITEAAKSNNSFSPSYNSIGIRNLQDVKKQFFDYLVSNAAKNKLQVLN